MSTKKPKFQAGIDEQMGRIDAQQHSTRREKFLDRHISGDVHAPHSKTKPIEGKVVEIGLEHITPSPEQPRTSFNEEALQELAASLKTRGVLQPIVVYWSDEQQTYFIIAGERRYRAAKRAGLEMIPAYIKPLSYDVSQLTADQLVENIQREDLAPIEMARALKRYIDEHQVSARQAAKQLGKSSIFVDEHLAILRIGEQLLVKAAAASEPLPKRALVEIGRAPEERHQELLALALSTKTPWATIEKKLKTPNDPPAASTPALRERVVLPDNAGYLNFHIKRDPTEIPNRKRYLAELLLETGKRLLKEAEQDAEE